LFTITLFEKTRIKLVGIGIFKRVLFNLAFPFTILNMIFLFAMPKLFSQNFILLNYEYAALKDKDHEFNYNQLNFTIKYLMYFSGPVMMVMFRFWGHFACNCVIVISQLILSVAIWFMRSGEPYKFLGTLVISICLSVSYSGVLGYYILLCDKIFRNQGAVVSTLILAINFV
jgi:hypothetical protein